MNQKGQTGKLGEDIAEKYLIKNGYRTIERNYRKKWGEIDIVVEKDGVMHFIEVKTGEKGGIRPEENITAHKRHQLHRIIQTYLFDKKIDSEADFQIDALIVVLDFVSKTATIRFIEDI